MMLKLYLYVIILTSIQSFVKVLSFSLNDGDEVSASYDDDLIDKIFNITDFAFTEEQPVRNSTLNPKLVMPCETPKNIIGLCIGIKQCPNLLNLMTNEGAWDFLRASMCHSCSENHQQNPKVCCAEADISKKPQKDIVDESMVLPKNNCGKQRKMLYNRIFGGTEAALGEFPWMARLRHKNERSMMSFGCSGFLICTKYVLTAAHCVEKKFVKVRGPVYSVVLGEHDAKSKIDCDSRNMSCADPVQISRVNAVIVHPDYDSNSSAYYNDIALIHLNKGIRFTEYVQPICLMPMDSNAAFKSYFLSGWGMTSEEGLLSTVKMKVEVPSVERALCVERYSSLGIDLQESQICAGGERGKDSCGGDSGGPLMALQTSSSSSNGDNWYAIGVVSFGMGCGIEGWPGVYTSVRHFQPWISRTIVERNQLEAKMPNKKRNKNHPRKSAK